MSFRKPNYTPEQRAAIKRGGERAMKFSPAGRAKALGTVAKRVTQTQSFNQLSSALAPVARRAVKKGKMTWADSVAQLNRTLKYTPKSYTSKKKIKRTK